MNVCLTTKLYLLLLQGSAGKDGPAGQTGERVRLDYDSLSKAPLFLVCSIIILARPKAFCSLGGENYITYCRDCIVAGTILLL